MSGWRLVIIAASALAALAVGLQAQAAGMPTQDLGSLIASLGF